MIGLDALVAEFGTTTLIVIAIAAFITPPRSTVPSAWQAACS